MPLPNPSDAAETAPETPWIHATPDAHEPLETHEPHEASATDEPNERLVCAILAEQVAALRDRMDTTTTFDLLWRTTALLSWLSGLLSDFPRHAEGQMTPVLERERAEALTEAGEIRRALNELAFIHAQHHDFVRQIADCVVIALERMAIAQMPAGTHFSSGDLAALYVSADQHKLHNAVMRRLTG